ncbi:MAG: homoserine dehydrogenase [Lachnospira sp.]|nr:homoserine dehydrogenase [Lachnospira sp.]
MKKTDNRNINIALLGAGTVGGGVYRLIKENREEFKDRTGAVINVKKVLVRDMSKDRPGFDKAVLTDDFNEIISDKDIEIVVELMGGLHPALEYVTESLKAGKQVVTANKDLIAEHGELIGNLAEQMGSDLLFEAAVAGAIPIIRPLKQSMAGNNISEIMGIVNGTTNYILTKMSETGMSYSDALAKATELGYAEADPTADVEGYDAGRKVAIMATIAFHSRVVFNQVYTEGITKITADDIRYAKEFGYVIKLVGVAKQTENGIEAKVHPMLIPEDHPLAGVRDSYNAVFVHGDAMEDITFMGRGAGMMPTASAVMGDVIDVCRDLVYDSCGRVGCNCYKKMPVKRIEDSESKFFLRIIAEDRPGVLANIASVLGNNDVSIAQVVQKSRKSGTAELVIITDTVLEKNINDALAVFKGMSVVKDIPGVIRVY